MVDDVMRAWLFDLAIEYNVKPVEADFPQLASLFELRQYKKGEFFIKPGENADRFGIIYKGISKYYYLDDQGKEYIKEFEKEGGMIGPYSELLQGIASRTHIQFLEDAQVFVADYPAYKELEDKFLSTTMGVVTNLILGCSS
jgi:CRP-like cAMP-binding protein